MKIQNLAVIFILIILPISIILSAFMQNQIKTLNLQTSYDSKLTNATYDAVKAFQLNTINSGSSDISDSKIRDIEASANTFLNSVSSNFGLRGNSVETVREYIPAIVYTMYDGYYIYSPYKNDIGDVVVAKDSKYTNNQKIYGVKPYIYYSCEYDYMGSKFVITYSLDNYISIQGKVGNEYVNKSGYIIQPSLIKGEGTEYRGVNIAKEELTENVSYYDGDSVFVEPTNKTYIKENGVKYYKDDDGTYFSILNGKKQANQKINGDAENNTSAQQYYKDAYEFTNWVKNKLVNLRVGDATDKNISGGADKNENIFADADFEATNSTFNQHRLAVIRNSIEKNLTTSIANYNNFSSTTTYFSMPKLKEDEWDKILNQVSVISFLQGMPIGGKVYNGYSIVTNNKNKEVVSPDSIYIADTAEYHKVEEGSLTGTGYEGVLNIDFERITVPPVNGGDSKYYYPKKQTASYSSIVNQTDVGIKEDQSIFEYLNDKEDLASVYYTALGRERYSMYHVQNDLKFD